MRKTLFSHQRHVIEKMEEREQQKKIIYPNYYEIELNMSILAGMTGFGKTVSTIGLLTRDNMEWDMSVPYHKKTVSGVFGGGLVVKKKIQLLKKLKCNLVVSISPILKQWIHELKETNLSFYFIQNKKKLLDFFDHTDADVVLCLPSLLNDLLEQFKEFSWKRLIMDEPTQFKIPVLQNEINAGFVWLVTSFPELLLTSQHKHFISKVFNDFMDYSLYKNIIIKNNDDWARKSAEMPPLIIKNYPCFKPVFLVVKDILSPTIQEMISVGNIQGAVRCLGGNSTSDIFQLIEKEKREQLHYLELKKKQEADKYDERIELIQKELSLLKQRIHDLVVSSKCPICLEPKSNPILVTCCQNMFCGSCVLGWFKNNATCPLCRSKIHSQNLVYYRDSCSGNQQSNEHVSVSVLPTKPKQLVNIIGTIPTGRKIILYSSFTETHDLIRCSLAEHNIPFLELKGHAFIKEQIVAEYKKNETATKILFIHSSGDLGSGFNLQETTDIIFYHSTPDPVYKQIVGRAYRIGRIGPLTIHSLQ